MRRDGLALAGKKYRAPQAGPRQPAVGGRWLSELVGLTGDWCSIGNFPPATKLGAQVANDLKVLLVLA